MKKNYILRTLLLAVALCGATSAWGQTYKKITTLDELESGKTYVVTGVDTDKALNATIGGGTTKYFTQTEVIIEDGILSTSEASIIWTITQEADGNYSLKCGDVYAGYSGSGNSAQAESEYAATCAWTISVADGVFALKNVAVTTEDRFLQHNSNNSRFATYKPSSNQKDLNLYIKYEATGTPAELKFEDGESKTKFYTEGATFSSKATTVSTATIVYSSSDEAVATIDSEGLVTLKGIGKTTIKAQVEANDTYQAGVTTYTLTVKGLSDALPYTNDFKSDLGNWINYTVVGTTEWKSSNYGAQINAYQKGATEAYLVSPAFDAENIVLTFGTQLAYSEMPLQLYYSTNFDPQTMSAPSEATWTEITDQAAWATSSTTVESGEITLNDLTAPVRFAFKYTSTDTDAGRWTITTVNVAEGEGPIEYCTYAGTNQHAERSFNSLTVTGGKEDFTISKYVGNGDAIYQDCTDQVLTASAGASLNFSASWNGEWMHGYLYIDYNNDGEFDAAINDNGTPAEGSEIVSYTFYSPTDAASGLNSAGETAANNGKLDYFPGFTLPEGLAEGNYRVRFKIDWCNLDACGIHADGKNSLNTNGGLILDFTLAAETATVDPGTGEGYDGKGIFNKVTSATDITTGKYVLVAGGLAMSNTVSSSKMLAEDLGTKLSSDALTVTDPVVAHVWDITVTEGICTIKNGESILGYNSGTNFTFNTTANETVANDQWTINTEYETPLFQSVSATSRFILLKSGTTTSPESKFAPYAQSNISANGYIIPVLYKLGDPSAIEEVENQVESLKVINGKGELTILANEATNVRVFSITGAMVVNTAIEAGNTVIALPAGIYIVNGVKAIVF